MKTAKVFRNEQEQIRVRLIETIKLIISKLFKNNSDVVEEICFAELDNCKSNPIYKETEREDEFTSCIDDVMIMNNELHFTYSSEIQDLIVRPSKDLSLDNLIDILEVVENLTEKDLKFN